MSIKSDNLDTLTKIELIDMMKTSLEEKKSLRYLLENMNGISWEFDLIKNKFIYVSSNAKEILGYETEVLRGMSSWASIIHEDDREKTVAYCAAESKKANDHNFEYRMIKNDGDSIWVVNLVTFKKDENKIPIKMCGFILDITEKKEAQLKLEKEHKFLQTVINGISDPVMIINSDYSVNVMNKVVQKTLKGRTFLDPLSPKCYEISHHRDSPCEGVDNPCPLKEVLETRKATKVLHNHRNDDGGNHFVELAASPLFDECSNCTGIIESARDVTEYVKLTNKLKKQVELTEHRATHDYLTGLPNRALFMDRLEQGIKDTNRNKTSLALFFIDLDHFKEINDTYGHHIGDKVLKSVCEKFKAHTRENDILSRLGGDEFTIIMKDFKTVSDIEAQATKFINIFKEPLLINEHKLKLSTSIGISIHTEQNNESADNLLQHADTAMYKAKEKGKDCFAFYEAYDFLHTETTQSIVDCL